MSGPPTYPVVQLGHQPCTPPGGKEGIDTRPGREVRGHRPPLDAVVDEVAHRVDHLSVAVALWPPAPARQPSRHRQQIPRIGDALELNAAWTTTTSAAIPAGTAS